jgi:chorismate mutase
VRLILQTVQKSKWVQSWENNMYQRGIRGAITVENNSQEDITNAVVELISEIKNQNDFKDEDISHVIFTLTNDLNCIYPAKIAREKFKSWQFVPMMCNAELNIENSLKKCLRILIVINTELSQADIKHVYLKGAGKLREDLR